MFPKLEKIIRSLAKNRYYQLLYSQSKEIGIKVFINANDLTDLQITFTQYLSFYNSLYQDIVMGEINEFILNDNIYEDAYSMFKNKERMRKPGKEQTLPEKSKEDGIGTTKIIFKTPTKRK